MKKIIAIGIIGIALTGCATTTPAPTVTITQPPVTVSPSPTETTPSYSPKEVLIAAVENKYGPLSPRQEKSIVDFAQDVCIDFDNIGVRRTLANIVAQVTSNKEAKFVGFIIGAGTAAFCPEYNDELGNGVSA